MADASYDGNFVRRWRRPGPDQIGHLNGRTGSLDDVLTFGPDKGIALEVVFAGDREAAIAFNNSPEQKSRHAPGHRVDGGELLAQQS